KNEIFRIVSEVMKTRTTEDWIAHLDANDVWSGPVYTYEDVEADPQIQHNETIRTINHPEYGDLKFVANPITFSNTPVSYQKGPPDLGEDNINILKGLGYSREEIDAMKKENIIQSKPPATYKL